MADSHTTNRMGDDDVKSLVRRLDQFAHARLPNSHIDGRSMGVFIGPHSSLAA